MESRRQQAGYPRMAGKPRPLKEWTRRVPRRGERGGVVWAAATMGVVSWSPPREEPVQTATGDGRNRGPQGTGVNIWDGDGGRVLSIASDAATESTEGSILGWMDGVWCFGVVGEKEGKGKGEKRGRCPGAPRILSPRAGGRRQGRSGLGEHSSHQSFRSLPPPPTPLTQGPTSRYVPFLLRTQWKTSPALSTHVRGAGHACARWPCAVDCVLAR